MQTKNIIITILAAVILAAIVLMGIYLISPATFKSIKKITQQIGIIPESAVVIEENLVIPDTQKITSGEARTVNIGNVGISLVPKSEGEKVIVEKAIFAVKGSYNMAIIEAQKWSAGAKLVFVKSLGAVTLEGKSSQWQLAFSSASKNSKGYEIIIQGDQIISKKEIISAGIGGNFSENLKDSGDAIKLLQELPQFSDATISSINLYYNIDGGIWRYTFSTSRGITSASAE